MQGIGVYDSGLGGLTVLRELKRCFPKEKFIYFADTAHLPYGTKSLDQIRSYGQGAGRHFQEAGVKALVVACNTATGAALDLLRDQMPCPVLGVIEPGAKAAHQASKNKKYALLATQSTIDRGLYQAYLKDLDPRAQVYGLACPQLVLAVEDGLADHYIGRKIVWEYLDQLPADYDTLILGCTHFPLAQKAVEDYFKQKKRKVKIVDPAIQTCLDLAETVKMEEGKTGKTNYYTSGEKALFKEKLEKIFGERVRVGNWDF